MQKKSKYCELRTQNNTQRVYRIGRCSTQNENSILCVQFHRNTQYRYCVRIEWKSIPIRFYSSCAYLQFTYSVDVKKQSVIWLRIFQICRRGQTGINGHWSAISFLVRTVASSVLGQAHEFDFDRSECLVLHDHRSLIRYPVEMRACADAAQRKLFVVWTINTYRWQCRCDDRREYGKTDVRYYLTSKNVEIEKKKKIKQRARRDKANDTKV